MNGKLPTASQAKAQARRLRAEMAGKGKTIGHGEALEQVAHAHAFRDWNAMLAAIGSEPAEGWAVGDRVTGAYLSQPFAATIVGVATRKTGWIQLELELDDAVDVVAFDSFSNLRKRVRGVIGPKGHSAERSSNGQPHLVIDLTPN